MSIIGDDEEELKTLVTSSLQSSGVLGKIKVCSSKRINIKNQS